MLQGTRYPSLGGLDWPRYLPILIMQGFLNYVVVHFIICALRFPEENNEASDTGFCHPCVGNTSVEDAEFLDPADFCHFETFAVGQHLTTGSVDV